MCTSAQRSYSVDIVKRQLKLLPLLYTLPRFETNNNTQTGKRPVNVHLAKRVSVYQIDDEIKCYRVTTLMATDKYSIFYYGGP